MLEGNSERYWEEFSDLHNSLWAHGIAVMKHGSDEEKAEFISALEDFLVGEGVA